MTLVYLRGIEELKYVGSSRKKAGYSVDIFSPVVFDKQSKDDLCELINKSYLKSLTLC